MGLKAGMVPPADYLPSANPQSFMQYDGYVAAALGGLASTNQEWSVKALALLAQRAHLLAEAAINEQIRRNQLNYGEYWNLY